MSRLGVLLVLSCCAAGAESGRAAVTPLSDAIAVRAMYKKLWIAWRVHKLHEGELDPVPTDLYQGPAGTAKMRLELSHMKEGPISEIADNPLADLVSRPSGHFWSLATGTWTLVLKSGEQLHAEEARPVWSLNESLFHEDWNVHFGKLFESGPIIVRWFCLALVEMAKHPCWH